MSKTTKVILGIGGTIFLGALGSGFWDLCLRDFFIWVGHGILSIVTLGIGSVRDSFYVEIAKGHTDRAVLYLFPLTSLALGTLMGVLFGKRPRMTEPETPSHRDARYAWWSSFLLLSVMTFIFMFRSISVTYVCGAVDHFEQSFMICQPYIPPAERDQIRSRFAQIHSKADYVAILEKLEDTAKSNHIDLPKFSVW